MNINNLEAGIHHERIVRSYLFKIVQEIALELGYSVSNINRYGINDLSQSYLIYINGQTIIRGAREKHYGPMKYFVNFDEIFLIDHIDTSNKIRDYIISTNPKKGKKRGRRAKLDGSDRI